MARRTKKESKYYVPQTMEEWEEIARISGLKKEPSTLSKLVS